MRVMEVLARVVGTGSVLGVGMLLGILPRLQERTEFEELTVQRLNVVDADGTGRIVLSGVDRFPDPVLDGKTYPRTIRPAGIVFYDADGNECGGIGLAGIEGVAEQNMMILDYANSEAIGFGVVETEAGSWQASLTIADRMPTGSDPLEAGTSGTPRITLSNEDGASSIQIQDARGRARIVLAVDREDRASIRILNGKGEIVEELGSD